MQGKEWKSNQSEWGGGYFTQEGQAKLFRQVDIWIKA